MLISLGIVVSFSHVVRSDAFGYFEEYGQCFEYFFYHLTRYSFHRIWKNILFEECCRTLSCFGKFFIWTT